ncbi:MAG: autotransporter domain-containing protein [Planctomycetaceae bacterium]|nr:autotransporter domain-containing protein [Planctomycetaceae bacterium]
MPTIDITDSQEYVIGLLTNNSNVIITPQTYLSEKITVENEHVGFAGGLIYYSTGDYREQIGYSSSYYSFSFEVTSAGDAVGVGFLGGGNLAGSIYTGEIKVEATGNGYATGISVQNMTEDYYYNGISASRIEAISALGTATGIEINDIGTYKSIAIGQISSLAGESAIGAQIHDIGRYADVDIGNVTSAAGNSATGIRINDIGNYAEVDIDDVTSIAGNSATGVWINNIGTPSDSIYSTSNGSTVTVGDVIARTISGTGEVVGMRVGNVHASSVTVGHVTATAPNTDSNVYGFILDGDIKDAHSTYGYSYYQGEVVINSITATSNGGSGDVTGLTMRGGPVEIESSSSYYPYENTLTISGGIDVTAGTGSTGNAIGIGIDRSGINIGSGFSVNGNVVAQSDSGDAYGLRVGNETHRDVSLGNFTIESSFTATSQNGNAYGIFSYSGNNSITIFGNDGIQVVGQTNNPDKFGASVYLGGANNSFSILGNATFTNNVKPFTVFGAQEITLGSNSILADGSFFEKIVTVNGTMTSYTSNKNDKLITISIDAPPIEKVTISRGLTLGDGGYFEPLTKEIIIENNAVADFGDSEFKNREFLISKEDIEYEANRFVGEFQNGLDSNYESIKLVTLKFNTPGLLLSQGGDFVFDASDSKWKLSKDSDIELLTEGLHLSVGSGGVGTFHGDQVFRGISGEGTVLVEGNAEFIGVDNYSFNGQLYAENVTVNKNHLLPNTLGSHVSIGYQQIGELYTNTLTVNTGTLEIIDSAWIGGLKSSLDTNGNPITTGKVTGLLGSRIEIDVDDDEDFVYGGLLQMDHIVKWGGGKQTVGELITSNLLEIRDGEIAVTGSAKIAGVQSDLNAGKNLYVGGNLTIDVPVDEIIKISSGTKIRSYNYKQHDYSFTGNLTAGSITKKGKGIQRFDSIDTGVITFGEGNDGELEDSSRFNSSDELIDVDGLIGTKDLLKGGELVARQYANFTGIEGGYGKLSGGSFVLTTNENHFSNAIVSSVNFTKEGQGKQNLAQLITNTLTVNKGDIIVSGDIRIVSGLDGEGGQVTGKNITIGEIEKYTAVQKIETINGQQKIITEYIPKQNEGTEINGNTYFPDNQDHIFSGNLIGYNVTKKGTGSQSFNKLQTTNDLNLAEGQIQLNQIVVGGTLSLAQNTTLDLNVVGESQINAIGNIDGTILVHGSARPNTVAIKFGDGIDRNKIRIAFTETPDQFITWRLGANSIFAEPNSQAYMSESYLSSLLLHDHRSAWNAISKRLNQPLPNSIKSANNFLGQTPYFANANKSLWFNYVGRTGEHKSSFDNQKFKLRADGIQVAYNVIPTQTTQYGLLFGYEGQSSTMNRDTVNGDDTYIGIYGTKRLALGVDLRAMLNYGHQDYDLTRYAKNTAGYNKANYNGDTVEGILEVGRTYAWGRQLTIRPLFAVELYYNMINRTTEDDNFNTNTSVMYDLATLKQTLLRFGGDWRYEVRNLVLSGGFHYSFNYGTDKLSTTVTNNFGQRLALRGTKLGRSSLIMDIGGQYFMNELKTRSIFASYTGNLYPDRKNTPITGTFQIGFQFDF